MGGAAKGMVCWGSHQHRGLSARLAGRGCSPEWPPPLPSPRPGGDRREQLPNWRVFHLFVFTVINPSERAPSVAPGSAGEGTARQEKEGRGALSLSGNSAAIAMGLSEA